MPTKLEWMSLVCRIVKVFFPSTAAAGLPCKTTMAPVAAEAAKISRRVGVFIDMIVTVLQAGLATNIAQSASYKLIKNQGPRGVPCPLRVKRGGRSPREIS